MSFHFAILGIRRWASSTPGDTGGAHLGYSVTQRVHWEEVSEQGD